MLKYDWNYSSDGEVKRWMNLNGLLTCQRVRHKPWWILIAMDHITVSYEYNKRQKENKVVLLMRIIRKEKKYNGGGITSIGRKLLYIPEIWL